MTQIIRLLKHNENEVIQSATEVLKGGGLIIYPTETCYGVGVDATNQKAVDRLLRYKERPEGKAISIAVANESMARQYVEINETAKNLYRNFLPGPLTVISRSKGKVAKGLEAENGTLGARVPNYQTALALISQFGKAITATSANASGKKTPYKIDDVMTNLTNKQKGLVDLIIDAGDLPHNPSSTVVDTTLNELDIIRKGEIDLKKLSAKRKVTTIISSSESETQKIGERLMGELKGRLQNRCFIFALQGELGVGKTQFAKGVGKALGITANINSPTFTLMNEYPFKIFPAKRDLAPRDNFYHIDTWRMREGKELLELGFEQMIKPGNVIVIEWLQKVKGILEAIIKKKQVMLVWIDMQHQTTTTRVIKILR